MENLIGRKVRGFKFETRKGYAYLESMKTLEGKIGEIVEENHSDVRVLFDCGTYRYYPLDQIKEHLVDEVPTNTYERWVTVKASELKELREFKESIKKLL